jgi:hypothetical protein
MDRRQVCLVTVDVEVSMVIIRPDTTVRLPDRDLPMECALQTASRKTLPNLKEALVALTLGLNPLRTLVFVAGITDELILGLNIHAHGASVDLRHHVL